MAFPPRPQKLKMNTTPPSTSRVEDQAERSRLAGRLEPLATARPGVHPTPESGEGFLQWLKRASGAKKRRPLDGDPADYDAPMLASPLRRVLAWLCFLVTWFALFAALIAGSVAAGEVLPEVLSWIVDGLCVAAFFVLGMPAKRAILRRFRVTRPDPGTSGTNSDRVGNVDRLT